MKIQELLDNASKKLTSFQLWDNPITIEGDVYSYSFFEEGKYAVGTVYDGPNQDAIRFFIPSFVFKKMGLETANLLDRRISFTGKFQFYKTLPQFYVTDFIDCGLAWKTVYISNVKQEYQQFVCCQDKFPKLVNSITLIGVKNSHGINDFKKGLGATISNFSINEEFISPMNAETLASAIRDAAQTNTDAICFVRGGGDKNNDLFFLNERPVLDAIIEARTMGKYIISGVAHSNDYFVSNELVNYLGEVPLDTGSALAKTYRYKHKFDFKKKNLCSNSNRNLYLFILFEIVVYLVYKLWLK